MVQTYRTNQDFGGIAGEKGKRSILFFIASGGCGVFREFGKPGDIQSTKESKRFVNV